MDPGGCHGFRCSFSLQEPFFDINRSSDEAVDLLTEEIPLDPIITQQSVLLNYSKRPVAITDTTSLAILDNCIVDYENELIASRFVLKQNTSSSSCGCKESFSKV